MSFFRDTFAAQWRRPMTHPRRIAVNAVRQRRCAAVPPHCHGSVTIMHVRRLLRPACGLVLAGLLAGMSAPARAESAAQCRPEPLRSGRVAAVVDGRTFVLDDGREVRLAAIEVPPLPHAADRRPRRQGRIGGQRGACCADRRPRGRAQAAAAPNPTVTAASPPMPTCPGTGSERWVERELLAAGARPGGGAGTRRLRGRAHRRRKGRAGGQAWPVGRSVLCHETGRKTG